MTDSAEIPHTGWTADDATFGARLALVRQRMGWGNVKEAAHACGLPAESWRRWERDDTRPRDVGDIADQISQATGCDYAWLLDGPRLVKRETHTQHEPRVLPKKRRSGSQPTVSYETATSQPIGTGPSGPAGRRPSPTHPPSGRAVTTAPPPSGRVVTAEPDTGRRTYRVQRPRE